MRRFLLVSAIILGGCVTPTPPSNGGGGRPDPVPPVVKSYPQDTEQCIAQPEVIWCQQACKADPEYSWCSDE